jgi:methanogenic corrinoid protein MtbC1
MRSRLDDWRSHWRNPGLRALLAAQTPAEHRVHGDFADAPSDKQGLSLIIENVVIPHLIADCDASVAPTTAALTVEADSQAAKDLPDETDPVEQLAQLSVKADTAAMLAYVNDRLAAGNSVEAIFVDLLAPAARRLGEYWEADSEDFVAVTMGLWRIQEVLRDVTGRIPASHCPAQRGRTALFSAMPGDQHSFGTLMVAECFERAGWQTRTLIEPALGDITRSVASTHYDLVGLTVSCDCPTATLTSLVSTLRSVSFNPQIRIMMGGRLLSEQPSLVGECGADATAKDARAAVVIAEQMVPIRADFLAQFL